MIGILTEKIQFNQQSIFLLKNCNELNQTNTCCVFCNEMHHRPVDIRFNIMQQIQSYSFEGTLVTDSILLTQNLHYNLYTKKKYYYVWNLDWMNLDGFYCFQMHVGLFSQVFM